LRARPRGTGVAHSARPDVSRHTRREGNHSVALAPPLRRARRPRNGRLHRPAGDGGETAQPSCSGAKCDSRGDSPDTTEFEYIVVGSGAGGGPLASRLARAGARVLLLEAGEDAGDKDTYQVPALHPQSTEDPALAWWYFVDHYIDPARQQRDSKIT
jgi:hypothetical protein